MITYTFLLKKMHPEFPEDWDHSVGSVVEVDLNISQYDSFKERFVETGYLERYFVDTPGFAFDKNIQPPGKFMERMSRIQQSYPGAKNMFDNSRWIPKREW